ncbi:hypothetical protein GGX14DRAFT_316491, partial [Mycena pura]
HTPRTHSPLMSLGCAQNADGSLKDAADIVWHNDVDSVHPISSPVASTSVPGTHPFFDKANRFERVAGPRGGSPPRRSARTHLPSKRMVDPNNVE